MATPPINKNKKTSLINPKDISLIVRIISANWWVPLVVLPLFYVIGYFYVYRLTTIYLAQTEFLLQSNDAYYQGKVVSDGNFYSYGSYVDNLNEKRVIQSYDLSSKVVSKLKSNIQVSYYIVGKVLTTEEFKGMPFKVVVSENMNPGYFERVFDFKVIDKNNYELSFDDNGTKEIKKGQFNSDLISPDLLIRIDTAGVFSKEIVENLKSSFYQFTIHSEDYLISSIRSNLVVDNPEYTNILQIGLKDILPERAVLILDTLNTVYSMSKLQTKFDLNERTIQYIDRQLDEITFALKSLEDTMQNYKIKRSIIDLGWEQQDFLGKIGQYDNQRSQLKLSNDALNDLEKYIIEDKDPQFLPPSVFVSEKAGFMNTAVADLYMKQIELNKLYNVAKETNPVIIDLKTSIKKTKQDLLVYINNSRKATNMQIESVNNEIVNYIEKARLIPGKQRDVLNIQRKANVSEQLYNFLLEKKASTKIAKASIVPDIKIVEAPRNVGPHSPDKPQIQKQFLSAGGLLSILIIFLRAFLYSKIKTVEHLKELTDIPLIGILPMVKTQDNEGIVVEQSPNSLASEAFRNFRTNIQYANVGIDAKTFLITSFLPGEGKTFTSVNLATILAKSGKRTVILEVDLHKPKIFKRFGLMPPSKGITTYISGQNELSDIVSKTHIENLYCIYSGPVPPNPSDFVLSVKMKELIEYAKEHFDFVIIDTPPAGLLSDAVYLLQYADASVFVLNTKSTTKRVITFIENLIVDNELKNITLLLNGVKKMTTRYYYQGYGYSYGYGYGYGYGKGYGYKK